MGGASTKNETETSSSFVLNDKYKLSRTLGRGAFAKVCLATDLSSGGNYAVKIISKYKVFKWGLMDQVKREVSLMKMLKHPNIVQLYEVSATKTKIFFIMEYVKGGELMAKIRRGGLNEDVARSYFRQLIYAVDFCHRHGVYHRDLKPENLLLDENGCLKVTDFGLGSLSDQNLGEDGLLHTMCGTPSYVAPEVIRKRGYDGAKADIWSCGVILFVLLAGFLPFQDSSVPCLYQKICKGDIPCPPWFSPKYKKLIKRLLDPNPQTRMSIEKLMQKSWFKEQIPKRIRRPQVNGYHEIEEEEEVVVGEEEEEEEEEQELLDSRQPETLNAFHLISYSRSFSISGLFINYRDIGEEREEIRFATTTSIDNVISKLDEAAKGVGFNVERSKWRVRMTGQENGCRGKLRIIVVFYPVTAQFIVVEVKREKGDRLAYIHFCNQELRQALKDIMWKSADGN